MNRDAEVGALTGNNSSPRTALLISGQVRSDDSDLERIAVECEHLDIDIFICVWRKRGTKGFGGGQGLLQLTRIFGDELTLAMPRNWIGANMRNVFPKSDHILPDLGHLTERGLAKIFPNATIRIVDDREDLTIPYMDSNSLRMLYMINACNRMKQESERNGGFNYDVVIRHRPDIRLDYERSATQYLARRKVLLPKSDVTIQHLHDIYWVCSSAEDNILTSLYDRAESLREKGWKGIHNELFDWTISRNIDYEMYPCAATGLNDIKDSRFEVQEIAARNFVQAVKSHQFDVELGGGAFFCDTYSLVFEAIFEKPFLDQLSPKAILDDIQNQKIRPKLKLFLLQAVCWLICFDKDRQQTERHHCLLIALTIDELTKNQRAAKWAAAAAPRILTAADDIGALTDVLINSNNAVFADGSIEGQVQKMAMDIGNTTHEQFFEAYNISARTVLLDNQNWKWFAANLRASKKYQNIIRMCEIQQSDGIYVRDLVNQALWACQELHDSAKIIDLLKSAASISRLSHRYAELGKALSNIGRTAEAKQALQDALKYPDPPGWAITFLNSLENS